MNAVAPAAGSPLVKVEGLRQTYPKGGVSDLLVLDDVSLALRDNEIVALLGRSGCGKSTLLRIIAGLLPATSGSVTIAGQRISGPAGQVAMVFQTFALFPHVIFAKRKKRDNSGSPTALMQSLKHYKVLHEHDVIRHALWLTISCGRNSAFGGTAVMRQTSLNGSRACWRAIAMAQNSLSQNIYYGV